MWTGIDDDFKEIFTSKDTVFHYTSVYTALEYILHTQHLRLSPRKDSVDPIENISPIIKNTSSYAKTIEEHNELRKDQHSIVNQLNKHSKKLTKDAKQLCLCMNESEDNLGFLKPRMWDQYADQYKGVSLAFSLEELKKIKYDGRLIQNDIVNYKKYSDLKKLNHLEFDKHLGKKIKLYKDFIDEQMFTKHMDYQGENEYRFLATSREDFIYINIKDAIKGIVISDKYTSEFAKRALEDYADKNNLKILYIFWNSDGVDLLARDDFYLDMEG